MAAPSLAQHTFLPFFSLLMTTEVFSATVSPDPDIRSLICTNPAHQYTRHPLDCSRWFHCPDGKPVEMPACINSMTFSLITFSCISRRNESNDCVSTCMYDGKHHYLGETFVGRNSCEKCICQNNKGNVVCTDVCLSKGATCSSNGRTYQVGQYFMYSDGCNTCLCEEQGRIRCTDIKCQTNKVTCYYQENVYVAGETFAHLDSQHSCTCRLDGVISCSLSHARRMEDEMNCLYDRKWRRAGTVFQSVDHCNQCECLNSGHVPCTNFNCSSPRQSLNGYKVITPLTPATKSIISSLAAQIQIVCYYENLEYQPGDTFTATNGCNSCSCSQTGKVHCTKKVGCSQTEYKVMCLYNEKEYKEGESFFALDGCNYCSCDQYGQVQCTERNCKSTPATPTTMPTILSSTTKGQLNRPTNTCSYKGKKYNVGKTFSTPCDICYCSLDGNVHCIRLTCSSSPDLISQQPSSEHPNTPTVISTPSENNISPSSDVLSTKAININIPKFFATDESMSLVTEPIVQGTKYSRLSIPMTSETPLTQPDQRETLNESTTRHPSLPSIFVSAIKSMASHKHSALSKTTSTSQLQNIIFKNATLFWNLNSQNTTFELPSLLSRTQGEKSFAPLESETILSNIVPPSLLNFSNSVYRKKKYFNLISPDSPKPERPLSHNRSTFKTPGLVELAATFESESIAKEGVTTELENAETNEKSTDNLEVTVDSIRKTADRNASTNPQLLTTVKNELKDFITVPRLSVTSGDETLQSEISAGNKTKSSLSSETTTNFIANIFNANNSTSKNVTQPSLFIATAKQQLFPNITTESESLFLSTLINNPNAVSTHSPTTMKSFLTPSPSSAITIHQETTILSLPKNYNTISILDIDTLNKSMLLSNKKSVSKPPSEIFFETSPEVTLSNSMKAFQQPTVDAIEDRLSKNTASLNSTLGSSTTTSFMSSEVIGIPISNSINVTESKIPQTTHISTTSTNNVNIPVKSNSFISNTLITSPSSVEGTTTSIFNTKTTTDDNSFNISTNYDIFSITPPTKYISVSSLMFAEQSTLIAPTTTNDTNSSSADKQFEVTSSTVTTESISNRSLNDMTAKSFKQYITTNTTGFHIETITPFNSISKSTSSPYKIPSVPSKTATNAVPLTRPIAVIPITTTNNRPFFELTGTHSPKVTLTTLKDIHVPTTAPKKAKSISSITFTKSPKLLSNFITLPIVTSTKPIPFTKTNSKLMLGVSKKSTQVSDLISCSYHGRKYQIWDVFTSEDECNTCECLYRGIVYCTELPCHDQKERMISAVTQTTTPHQTTTRKNLPTTPALDVIPCIYNGVRYSLWDAFPSFDGCNICDCLYHGFVHCTDRQCPDQRNVPIRNEEHSLISTPETCKYKNQVYQIGQTFLSGDKCTLCNCTVGGHINCTDIHCPSENIQLNDRKSNVRKKLSPKPIASGRPSVTVASTLQMMTQAPVANRALCWYNGLSYKNGEKFNSEDNCNTCTCMLDSLVTCTQLPCNSKNVLSDHSTCSYNGHIFQNGQMFNSADGCNTCGCLDGGTILCTSQLCGFNKDQFKVPMVTISPVKCSYNGQTYNAGDVFNSTDNCNLCNCTQNGRVECTQKACRRGPEKLQYDAPADLPDSVTCSFENLRYKPKQVFQMADGCNVCTCTDDGRIICTNKKCLLNDDETKGRPNSAATFTTTTLPRLNVPNLCTFDGQTFQAGDIFSAKDGCNSCNCTVKGEVKCTKRKCPLNIAGKFNVVAKSLSLHVGVTCIYEGEKYKPHHAFPSSDGCNTCTCSDVGRIHCTDNVCPVKSTQSKGKSQLAVKTIRITTKAPILEECSYNRQIYRIGDTFYSIDGCNLCNCSYKGIVKCAQKSCLPRNEEASKDVAMPLSSKVGVTCFYEGYVYQPDERFPSADKCNTCVCSNDGQVHCTNTLCSDTKQSKDEPLQDGISESCYFDGKQYTVGDTFDLADGCNMCGCSDKGKILCTKRTCYPEILQNREFPQTAKATTTTPQVARLKKTLCYYNGHSYISGRIFKAADSCNMCGCLQNGMVHCTKTICETKIIQTTVPPTTTTTSAVPKHISLVKCRYFGQKYNVGEMFDVQNGCNMCACLAEGIVRCTKQRCDPPVVFCKHGGNVYFLGQTFADDCNTCKCGAHGIIICTELHCGSEDDGRCNYNGQEHEQGDTFRSSDGCHLCTCSSNTRITCRPVPSCQGTRNIFEFSSRERSEEEYLDD